MVYARTRERHAHENSARRTYTANEIREKDIRVERARRNVKKTETAGTPENRRNKVFAAQKMVHGSRGVEIKRRYCFFRRANANGKIVAWARKWKARSSRNGTLPRINARVYVLFTSLRAKGNELHVTDQKICTRAIACLRGPRIQITSFAAVRYI
jgi:hypothetical protein